MRYLSLLASNSTFLYFDEKQRHLPQSKFKAENVKCSQYPKAGYHLKNQDRIKKKWLKSRKAGI